jgi:transposase, IS30 family
MKQPVTYKRLSSLEREEISRALAQGHSFGQIGTSLRRETSTISRELSRLRYRPGTYRATFAEETARRKRNHHAKTPPKLLAHASLRQYVVEHVRLHWSPEQIAARLRIAYPNDQNMRVSHETIYTYIYCQAKGELKQELKAALRQQKTRRGRPRQIGDRAKFSPIPELVSIAERPKEVENRVIPGHWEGDIIAGQGNHSFLGSLVERTTRATILVPLKAKQAELVARAFAHEVRYLPQQLKLTLTYDRGSEMARHKLFTSKANMQVYFADPQSPWQRGTNENTNGLVRQFFPKMTDFNTVTRKEIKRVQHLLNGRPRKVLAYRTPYEAFSKLLAEKGEAIANELMLR